MFFTHELLVGPSGRFSLIWRAAMKKEKIKKRKLEALDVYETCQDLVKYIRPSSDSRMGHIRGFSLRLSAQLVHGVIVCYNMKVAYFLDEVLSSWKSAAAKRYLIQELCNQIAKPKRSRSTSAAAEENFQLQLNFGEDPMFGRVLTGTLEDFPVIDPPHTTSEETTSPSSSESAKKRRKSDRNAVADISQITMQEGAAITFADASDLLMQGEAAQFQLDDFNEFGAAPSLFDNMPVPFKDTRPDARQGQTTPAGAILPDTPSMPAGPRRSTRQTAGEESVLAVPILQDSTIQGPDEEQRQAGAGEQEILPEPTDAPPSSLVLEPLDAFTLSTRKRKPRKLTVDARIELTGAEIKQQLRTKPRAIDDQKNEGTLGEPLNLIPASSLLSTSCIHGTSHDPTRIGLFPKRSTEEVDIHNLFAEAIEDVEKNLQLPRTFELEQDTSRTRSIETMMDESSMQPVRDASGLTDIGIPPDLHSISEEGPSLRRSLRNRSMHDVSERSRRDHSILPTEISDITLPEPFEIERSHVEMPGLDTFMEPIHQEPIDEGMLLEMDQFQEASVLGNIEALWERERRTTFSKLAPPRLISRQEAAKRFYGLLACAKSQTVKLTQKECFGEIWIEKRDPLAT